MTILYIHGYGSNGSATKGQLLRSMLPEHRVVSPTFDYDHRTPEQIQEQIKRVIGEEEVRMIVGSSFGGYHSLCATAFFHGPVWVVNPVHDVEATIRRVIMNKERRETDEEKAFLKNYSQFNREVFLHQVSLNQSGGWPEDTPLHFALSTDDELLGDHTALLELFPHHKKVVWKDRCGHRFFRFEELSADIAASIPQ